MIPLGYILQKVPARKWLAFNVVAWGIATACIGATKDYHTLLVARIFLGTFEAAVAPSVMLISSQYYTRSEQAIRYMYWFFGLPVAQIGGALISFAFQHIGPGHLAGWRIMFIVLGAITVIIGVATYFILPDSPMSAKFLSDAEKIALLMHVSENRTGIENRHFKASQLVELLLDIQIWLMALLTILVRHKNIPPLSGGSLLTLSKISISSGVIVTYSSTVIRQFGYSSKVSALLGMPTGAVSLLFTLLVGYGVRYTSHRWAWLIACCIPGIYITLADSSLELSKP